MLEADPFRSTASTVRVIIPVPLPALLHTSRRESKSFPLLSVYFSVKVSCSSRRKLVLGWRPVLGHLRRRGRRERVNETSVLSRSRAVCHYHRHGECARLPWRHHRADHGQFWR